MENEIKNDRYFVEVQNLSPEGEVSHSTEWVEYTDKGWGRTMFENFRIVNIIKAENSELYTAPMEYCNTTEESESAREVILRMEAKFKEATKISTPTQEDMQRRYDI